jgi:hypothetical protein
MARRVVKGFTRNAGRKIIYAPIVFVKQLLNIFKIAGTQKVEWEGVADYGDDQLFTGSTSIVREKRA